MTYTLVPVRVADTMLDPGAFGGHGEAVHEHPVRLDGRPQQHGGCTLAELRHWTTHFEYFRG